MLISKATVKKSVFLISWLLVLQPVSSFSQKITQEWKSKDKSVATITLKGGESIKLPKKGGGEVTIECKGAFECSVDIADFKDKKGKITYDSNLSGLQAATGTIDEGVGLFEITVNGDLENLFTQSTASGELISSTGFTAQIGTPGDQLPQGGTVSYSTEWFSDTPIGIDPLSGDEIILGDFFLDSIAPLTSFEYSITDPDIPLLSASFTVGELYSFSTGLTVAGTVSKEMTTVPEPNSALLFGIALPLLASRFRTSPREKRGKK